MTPITLAITVPLSRWVGWCNQKHNGNATKVPFAPLTGEPVNADYLAGWASRPEAEAGAGANVNRSGGGLKFGPVDGEVYSFRAVDLDTCRNSATGMIELWALAIMRRVNSHAELSPSCTGVKLFLRHPTADTAALRRVMGTNHGKQFKRCVGEYRPAIELHTSHPHQAERMAYQAAELRDGSR